MGDYITFSESLLVTFISMLSVFIVLVIVSVLITGLKVIGVEKEEVGKKKVEKPVVNLENEQASKEEDFNGELVAVIAAALACNLGLNLPDIKIKNIKKID